jgi:hypothetical protein
LARLLTYVCFQKVPTLHHEAIEDAFEQHNERGLGKYGWVNAWDFVNLPRVAGLVGEPRDTNLIHVVDLLVKVAVGVLYDAVLVLDFTVIMHFFKITVSLKRLLRTWQWHKGSIWVAWAEIINVAERFS